MVLLNLDWYQIFLQMEKYGNSWVFNLKIEKNGSNYIWQICIKVLLLWLFMILWDLILLGTCVSKLNYKLSQFPLTL